MEQKVKHGDPGSTPYKRGVSHTRISAKHQVTIPMSAFVGAGLKEGDAVRAEAVGPGRVVLTRQDALLDEFSGALSTKGGLRKTVEGLRDEWA